MIIFLTMTHQGTEKEPISLWAHNAFKIGLGPLVSQSKLKADLLWLQQTSPISPHRDDSYTRRRKKQRNSEESFVCCSAMALEAYASQTSNTVHTDVLSDARQACYKARDAFYACLERESNKKATEIASVGLLYPVDCKKSRAEFENSCRSSWVKHFDRQYCAKKRVQRLLEDNESRRAV